MKVYTGSACTESNIYPQHLNLPIDTVKECIFTVFQLDVKNAFLNEDLVEEVYMDIPPSFETEHSRGKVWKLQKSLYGLKQSPPAWFDRFTKVLKFDGYMQSQADHTLFIKHFTNGKIIVLIVYIDDIVLTGNHEEEMRRLELLLFKEFEINDLGHPRYFLGMEVARSKLGILVSTKICLGPPHGNWNEWM